MVNSRSSQQGSGNSIAASGQHRNTCSPKQLLQDMEVQEFVSQNEPFIAASIAATAIAVAAAAFANASCQAVKLG